MLLPETESPGRLLTTLASRRNSDHKSGPNHRRNYRLDDHARMALQKPKAFQSGIWQFVSWTNYGGPTEPLKVGDVLYVKPVVLSFCRASMGE